MIHTRFYDIEVRDGAVWNVFPDGATSANFVPEDGGQFARIARLCGFDDPQIYLLAHEVCHALVPETMFGAVSYVVNMAAHGKVPHRSGTDAEEAICWYVQRAACGAIPIVDERWAAVIARLRDLDLCGDPAVAAEAAHGRA